MVSSIALFLIAILIFAAIGILISIIRYNRHLDKVTKGEVHDTHSAIPEPRIAAGISYKTVLMLILILILFMVSTVSGIVATLQERMNNLESDMGILQNQLYQMQLSIEKNSSRIESFTYNLSDLRTDDYTVIVGTEALLKEYSDETVVQLVVGDAVYDLSDKGNGIFYADIERSIFDDANESKLIIKEPGKNYTEMVDFPACLVYEYLPMPSYECCFNSNEILGKTKVEGDYTPVVYGTEDIESVTVTYLSDGKELETVDITQETLTRTPISIERTVPSGQDFTFRIEVITKSGFRIAEQSLMLYSRTDYPDDYEYLRVYDMNGNLLWEDDFK
ncbi:MAG: hypothetical protein KBG42_07590 [Lachnospiraceae bacterium]|nr:hypothetical protein [Lachnospiraceae bacterium]